MIWFFIGLFAGYLLGFVFYCLFAYNKIRELESEYVGYIKYQNELICSLKDENKRFKGILPQLEQLKEDSLVQAQNWNAMSNDRKVAFYTGKVDALCTCIDLLKGEDDEQGSTD